MAKKICFAQSVKELKFILSKVEEPLVCVPLDLETQLYCYKNNLEFYNPINFIDSNFHKKSIEESEKLTNYLDLSHFTTESKKKIYIHNVMFEFNTIVFLIELIEKINTKEKSLLGNTYAYYYWVFPNIMLNFYNWGLSINIIEPISRNKTRVRFLSYPIKGCTQPIKNSSSLDKVEKEDQEIIKKVQKGINSQSYLRGRYSAMHEKGIHHFHQLICKYIN